VSGCKTHGELVGGYVLGALEPAEMEEMRRHVATCRFCGQEARELAALPALLDKIELADVPPPAPSPEVEEAVLDRFAREHARRAERPRQGASRWRPRRIAGLATGCAAAAVLALVLLTSFGDDDGGGGDSAYASVSLAAVADGSGATGRARAAEVPSGTRVWLWARGLRPRRGVEYELWCVRSDGRWISGGTFWAGRDGRAEAELTAAVRPGEYHVMVVTRRMKGAPEGERGKPILRGELEY
jgi:anti-sigma-K factor RskA